MTTLIALLRGINVGGNRRIRMADLREVFVDAGCDDVTTYVQSGNVVFSHRRRPADELAAELERRIEAAYGFEVPVVLRGAGELAAVVRDNPFPGAEPTRLHVAFLRGDPAPGALDAIDLVAFEPEELVLAGREVYLHLPNGMGRSKLPPVLGALETPATVRNWRTVTKLLELASEEAAVK